ncbi:MAG: hypothetical protein KDE27_26500 [Planctomycetes bacterium]|nr:hypothetical protein [Planctomycetota bacterium]
MKPIDFGNISMADYRKMVGVRERNRRRWPLVLGLGIACLGSMAAGDYFGPFTGKSARAMTVGQAVGLLEDASAPDWAREAAIGAAYQNAASAMAALTQAAGRFKDQSRIAGYSSLYLRNLVRDGIRGITALKAQGVRPEAQDESLRELRSLLPHD